MPPLVKRFVVSGDFVERVNSAMISGQVTVTVTANTPQRVRSIVRNTKLSETEMRQNFAYAIGTAKHPA